MRTWSRMLLQDMDMVSLDETTQDKIDKISQRFTLSEGIRLS